MKYKFNKFNNISIYKGKKITLYKMDSIIIKNSRYIWRF